MSTTFQELVTLTKIECGSCGGVYAISERVRQHHYDHSGHWTCPYCKVEWGFSKSQIQSLREELDKAERDLRASKCEILNERNLKEAAEKKIARVKKGVCPCCRRSFSNLARHIKTKHPEKAAN